MPAKYKFRSREALITVLEGNARILERTASVELDQNLRSFYNGKHRAVLDIIDMLLMSEIDNMELPS